MKRSFFIHGAFVVVRCKPLQCENIRVGIWSFWRWLVFDYLLHQPMPFRSFAVKKLSFGGLVMKFSKHLRKGKKLKILLYLPQDKAVLRGTVVKTTSDFVRVRFAPFGEKKWFRVFNSMEVLDKLKKLPSL